MPDLNPALQAVLLPAYAPCASFAGPCSSMRWAPERGHVPRGFVGATAALDDVRLVLVCAEPGDPHDQEAHAAAKCEATLSSTLHYTRACIESGTDQFHQNIRSILDLCFPDATLAEQLRRTWITDSVLCSAREEGGSVPVAAARACRSRYLEAQLDLLPRAVIVALGGKARERLAGYRREVLSATAAAPPGCNRRDARASWEAVAARVRAHIAC